MIRWEGLYVGASLVPLRGLFKCVCNAQSYGFFKRLRHDLKAYREFPLSKSTRN